jgi:hypothetical protein
MKDYDGRVESMKGNDDLMMNMEPILIIREFKPEVQQQEHSRETAQLRYRER